MGVWERIPCAERSSTTNARQYPVDQRGARKPVYQNKRIVGRFDTPHNQKKDLVLSQNVLKEMHNSLLAAGDRSPFPLRNNACILSYQVQNKRYYYKIEALQQQPSIAYPSAPPD